MHKVVRTVIFDDYSLVMIQQKDKVNCEYQILHTLHLTESKGYAPVVKLMISLSSSGYSHGKLVHVCPKGDYFHMANFGT